VRLRNLPLAWQLMGLTAASALAGSMAVGAVNLLGPPPRDPPTRVIEVVRMLDAAQPVRRDLVREISAQPPDTGGLEANERLADRIAERSGLPRSSLFAHSNWSRQFRGDEIFGDFVISRQLPDGRWLTVREGLDHGFIRWLGVTALAATLVLAIFVLLGWFAANRIVRPIAQLARAARDSRTGSAMEMPALDRAPPEVRSAAEALGDLHQRTLDHGRQQVTMLAAIAHDVGTPLARLAFRAEELGDNQREAAMRDIAIIRDMLADALNLSRHWNESAERVDLTQMCRDLVDAEEVTGADITFVEECEAVVAANPLALRRMVQNLVDNALRYGGSARLAVRCEGSFALLEVCDSGPGFPDIPAEELLRPFVRGEISRNRQSGGSGLGLAIANQVVTQAGGTISLGAAPGGGARVLVALPLAGAAPSLPAE
jgi:two-component system OmpR family sensor kinase